MICFDSAPRLPQNVTLRKDPFSPTLRISWKLKTGSEQDSVSVRVCRPELCPAEVFTIKKRRGEIPFVYLINTELLAQEVNYSFAVFATSYKLNGPLSSPVTFTTGE